LIELGREVPPFVKPTKGDIDLIYKAGKMHLISQRMSMPQLLTCMKRCIIDGNRNTLRIMFMSKNWRYKIGMINPYMICIDHADIDCMRIVLSHSGVNASINNFEAIYKAVDLNDLAALEMLKDVVDCISAGNPLAVLAKKGASNLNRTCDRLAQVEYSDIDPIGNTEGESDAPSETQTFSSITDVAPPVSNLVSDIELDSNQGTP
jgi:hypothetical protein